MIRTSLNSRRLLLKSKVSMKKDRISTLPDHLLCRILSKLPTEDSVRTSVLSTRWRNLWLHVPVLDLESDKFLNIFEFMNFFELFLESKKDLVLNRFKLIYNFQQYIHDLSVWQYYLHDLFTERTDDVIKRRVCHLTIHNEMAGEDEFVRMPLSLYSCATLVDLTLFGVALNDPELEPVLLPCLRTMHLEGVMFDNDWVLETLIANSLVLENLVIVLHPDHYLDVVYVRSKSLKSFKLVSTCGEDCEDDDHAVEVNAPHLEYMGIINYKAFSIIIESIGPYAKVEIDVEFDNDRSESSMIYDFFTGISTVREMIISARTLKMIDDYRIRGQLPQFGNLSCLHASFCSSLWEVLSYFLGCCLNLHSLTLEFDSLPKANVISTSLMPPCLASSLEYVKLTTPLREMSNKKKLAIYFVRNCKVLKELALNKSFRTIIQSIRKFSKRSPQCKIVQLNKL